MLSGLETAWSYFYNHMTYGKITLMSSEQKWTQLTDMYPLSAGVTR